MSRGVENTGPLSLSAGDSAAAEQAGGLAPAPGQRPQVAQIVRLGVGHSEGLVSFVGQSAGATGLSEVIVDKSILGIVTHRHDLLILNLTDGTLDNVAAMCWLVKCIVKY